MNDVVATFLVLVTLSAVAALVASSFPRSMRPWVWFAFVEYLLCAIAQLVYSRVLVEGGDMLYYTSGGAVLAKVLDGSFSWASREMISLLLQQPSAFDTLIEGGGSNTGSMFAISAWLLYFLGGSEYAVHFLVAGLSFFAALNIYGAFSDASPTASPVRLFVATVLFPSVAFWTSALHKEAFCLIGIGALLAAWRALYRLRFRALVYAPIGLLLILLFRAPAIPPLLLGLAGYIVVERFQKSRGADTVLLGPVYLGFGLALLSLGMLAVARVSPTLALDQLGDTMAGQQKGWALSVGGSAIDQDTTMPQTLAGQVFRAPLALFNALFRPQFFDIHNVATLLSAVEMTIITWLIIRAIRQHGIGAILVRIQRSPFLLMCAVTTLVGCTFVGLVTLNLGSLSRYRVPFLPFYGALLSVITERRAPASSAATAVTDRFAKGALRGALPGTRRPRARPRVRA
jgi:hypothetical protein